MDILLISSIVVAAVASLTFGVVLFVAIKLRHAPNKKKEHDSYINIDSSLDTAAVTSCVTTEYVQHPHKQPLER